jgi:glycopeptide antibiotics resistance protein
MVRGWVVWPFALSAAMIVWRRGVTAVTRRRILAVQILLALYLAWLAGETFFPLPLTAAALRAGVAAHPGGGWHADLTPFHSIAQLAGRGWRWPALRILAGNVCVFVPFGLLVPTAFASLATWRRVLLAAVALSASIELGQLAGSLLAGYSYRVTEIDDVILNVSGVLLGFALWSAARRGRRPGDRVGPNRRSEAAVLRHEHQNDHGHSEQRDDDGPSRSSAQAAALLGLLE